MFAAPFRLRWILILITLLAAVGCMDSVPDQEGDADVMADSEPDSGDVIRPEPPDEEERQALLEAVDEARNLSLDDFRELNSLPLQTELDYQPSSAAGLELIQESSVALDEEALATLDEHGFVIDGRTEFPSFIYGYETLYMEDLPLYVSADSIMFAVHRSYDDILKAIETEVLIAELDNLLVEMRTGLADGSATEFGVQAEEDLDFYLTVALSLLRAEEVDPVRGADAGEIGEFIQSAEAATGAQSTAIFGEERNIDFSQFTPRGHYTDSEALKQYFRTMMWLGRIDFRLIETMPDHSQRFNRRQFEAVLAMHALTSDTTRERWRLIDDTIQGFVGESDNMTLPQVTALVDDLNVLSPSEALQLKDEEIAQAILDGGYGTQRISSHIMINGLGEGTMPLSSTFLLFGQRYVVDSHVFSNVVYDRLNNGQTKRMMPDPLDVGYAVMGNNQAGQLLDEELQKYAYQGDLEAMRLLVEAHGDEFWHANLYNLWLSALRELSPRENDLRAPESGLPAVARTEAWGRRMLNTQLASWAELRHDTILYAKQSYTGGATCEFPDAYVDPYPEFYAALTEFAVEGQQIVARLDLDTESYTGQRIESFFVELLQVSSMLEEMARYQREGRPFTDTHMAFINEAVRIHWGCGDPAGAEGWYARLFFDRAGGVEFDPTIADVHTQPTDEVGAPVGRILHVGTGMPRAMVVTVDTCNGPRAYAGLASSYFERVTEDFDRLDDIRWSQELVQDGTPEDVSWLQDVVIR